MAPKIPMGKLYTTAENSRTVIGDIELNRIYILRERTDDLQVQTMYFLIGNI